MRKKTGQRIDLILIGIALLAAFLNMYNIWNDQYANAYYTSAVTSMVQSFHNFFFASFDPGGYVTIDKPPVTFWVQTIFAYFFGVHGWSVILPQALAGVGSVLLMYRLVKPSFGLTAARFASLVFACTPIAAAVSRTNNIDSLLVFTLTFAAWMLFQAVRKQQWYWVLGAFAMIGVGFNMKMLQAYMVVPAFYLFYFIAFKSQWKKKLAVLSAATLVLVGVSLSWAVVVDSTPAANRPYMGGSKTNSVLELAFGYNGISRLTGNKNGGGMDLGAPNGDMPNRQQNQQDGRVERSGSTAEGSASGGSEREGRTQNGALSEGSTADSSNSGNALPNGSESPQGFGPGGNQPPGQMSGGGPQGGGGMGGGAFGTGTAGPLRLFQTELSGQASWLLPLVAFACVGLLSGIRRRKPLTDKQKESFFWLAWLLPAMAFFSVAGFFHHYYLIMLAPPIAALAGAGWVELWNHYRNKEGWKMWLLPAALLATTAFQLYILYPFQTQIGFGWSIGIGAAGILISLGLLLALKMHKLSSFASIAPIAGLLVLLIGPLFWAATPIIYGGNSMIPQAGPSQKGGGPGRNPGGDGGGGMNSNINTKLLDYVTKNNTGEKFLFATTDANTAGPYIIKTGKAIMAMGGFSGGDSILTVARLEQMVANKEVKYFLIPSGSGGGRGGSSEVMDWIRSHSKEVASDEWQSSTSSSLSEPMGMGGGRENSNTLYQING